MKRFLLSASLLLWPFFFQAFGQHGYAYFYFEGDQETPFYIKVEGQMQPRYGQNYFIIPNLGAGYTNFEILFQQNQYPPQKFLLDVPDGGFRGFTLHKINDKQFSLFDLQQRRYIIAGNKKEDDKAPVSGQYFYDAPQEEELSVVPEKTKKPRRSINEGSLSLMNDDTDIVLPEKKVKKPDSGKTADSFLDGIVLNQQEAEEEGVVAGRTAGGLPPVANSDCPDAMSNEAFETFALRLLRKDDDDSRLKMLKKEMNNYCFSTEQVRIIASNLKGQSSRYEAVKQLYLHTSDQENYGKLESLFNTPFLKQKFVEILNP